MGMGETDPRPVFCHRYGLKPAFIKIDVAGAESLVFAGAQAKKQWKKIAGVGVRTWRRPERRLCHGTIMAGGTVIKMFVVDLCIRRGPARNEATGLGPVFFSRAGRIDQVESSAFVPNDAWRSPGPYEEIWRAIPSIRGRFFDIISHLDIRIYARNRPQEMVAATKSQTIWGASSERFANMFSRDGRARHAPVGVFVV